MPRNTVAGTPQKSLSFEHVYRAASISKKSPIIIYFRERKRQVYRSFSSSVDGTIIWMQSFHITVSDGKGDPVQQGVSGHPPRRGTFRGEICGMRSSAGTPQARPKLPLT
jgi:hypothetical protein